MSVSTRNAPSDDIRRRIARLLCRHWDLLSGSEQLAALHAAYLMGADLAEAGDVEAVGDATDYRRVCIQFASGCGEANDVEAGLWKGVTGDPRMAAFSRGFRDHRG